MPETIKEIAHNTHINWLSKTDIAIINGHTGISVLPYGYLPQAVNEALLSLLDEVEKRLPEERKSLDYSDQTQAHIRGSNWCRQQVIKVLSDLREK